MTPLLHVDGVGRRFGELTALDDVSLTIAAGGRHAVIGPNGAGKTTLLNLVAGTLPATAGRIVFDGRDITAMPVRARARLGIGRTWQHPAVFDRLPVATNLALAHHHAAGCTDHPTRWPHRNRPIDCVQELAGDAGLAEHRSTPAGSLSYGTRRRLEVAMALAAQPRLLLLDEPTAGLTAAEIDTLTRVLADLPDRTAVLLVDHHIDFVSAVADTITVLHHGAHITTGAPEQVRAHDDVRRVYLATDAGGQTETRPRDDTVPADGARPVLTVEGLRAGYHGAPVINQISLQLGAGQVVAVVGRSGAGKTTLINTIAGLHPARSGQITVDDTTVTDAGPRRRQQAGLSLVPQGRHLFKNLTVAEHLRVPQPARRQTSTPLSAADIYELFPTLAGRRRHRPGQLSGGEQQMLAMARALVGKPRALLLDEPSEGLAPTVIDDLARLITDLSTQHEVAVLLAEQNLPLALRVADQLCVLHEGAIALRTTPAAVAADPHLLEGYLGAAAVTTPEPAA
ncbi:ATP-binding cassette domain-containing protein [Phytohabitans kaempferiae]|uniref:ATP-binding cassette domain-containing protein n=1 Tax=Phytohabitans kaempferiae TaxID=1620943 RepID=A0ABV6MBU7_9ACTN